MKKMKNIGDIQHCLYINLESRTDRKLHVENQLKMVGIKPVERFNAVKLPNGALGCTMSHIRCLEKARDNNWDHVVIVEDDIEFTNPGLFMKQMNQFLSRHETWDVLLLGGNNMPPYKEIDNCCIQVSKCQTTTGYIVQKHYYESLIDNFRKGLNCLIREPDKHIFYALDKYWFKLQEKDRWFLIVPLTVIQKQDYSDIMKKMMNYSNLMLDLDKKKLIAEQTEKQERLKQLQKILLAKKSQSHHLRQSMTQVGSSLS